MASKNINLRILSLKANKTHGGKKVVNIFGVVTTITDRESGEMAIPAQRTLVDQAFWAESMQKLAEEAGANGVIQVACNGFLPIPQGIVVDPADLADAKSELGALQRKKRLDYFTTDRETGEEIRKYQFAGMMPSESKVLKAEKGEMVETKSLDELRAEREAAKAEQDALDALFASEEAPF